MAEVERDILEFATREDHGLTCRMGETEFIKHVGVLLRQVGQQYFRLFDLLPDLLYYTTGRKQLVSSDGFKASVLDGRNIYVLVVPVVPVAEWHHHEAC